MVGLSACILVAIGFYDAVICCKTAHAHDKRLNVYSLAIVNIEEEQSRASREVKVLAISLSLTLVYVSRCPGPSPPSNLPPTVYDPCPRYN